MDPKIQALTELLRKNENLLRLEVEKREAAEKELGKNKEILKLVMKEMPVIILATDKDGSIVFFNREFERVSGYTAEDISDYPQLLELLLPKVANDVRYQSEPDREWRLNCKDGTQKVVIWSNISMHPPIRGWKTWKVGVDVTELKATLAKVRTLSGLLPICASCKKIRDDTGYWNQIESYIHDYSEAEFSHSICPECAQKLYPDLDIYE
jgi:PAS domain S-box-containing protein